eukprot:TRINITY_DN4534_c2_g1_i2.p1 TRINITY_DN4534_c2_g1~~TRINITY_DN4534_c2_g1_i2.p1  ORF type:complete len:390 (+),score=94.13 TRINITY_DN4534_c2_g1_i2:93-1262(+)
MELRLDGASMWGVFTKRVNEIMNNNTPLPTNPASNNNNNSLNANLGTSIKSQQNSNNQSNKSNKESNQANGIDNSVNTKQNGVEFEQNDDNIVNDDSPSSPNLSVAEGKEVILFPLPSSYRSPTFHPQELPPHMSFSSLQKNSSSSSKRRKRINYFDYLSPDLYLLIFSLLPLHDFIATSLVSKTFYNLSRTNYLWNILFWNVITQIIHYRRSLNLETSEEYEIQSFLDQSSNDIIPSSNNSSNDSSSNNSIDWKATFFHWIQSQFYSKSNFHLFTSSSSSSYLSSIFSSSKSRFKGSILGLESTGKTSLLSLLSSSSFPQSPLPTLGFNLESIHVQKFTFDIYDVGGNVLIEKQWVIFSEGAEFVIWGLYVFYLPNKLKRQDFSVQEY